MQQQKTFFGTLSIVAQEVQGFMRNNLIQPGLVTSVSLGCKQTVPGILPSVYCTITYVLNQGISGLPDNSHVFGHHAETLLDKDNAANKFLATERLVVTASDHAVSSEGAHYYIAIYYLASK